MTFQSWTRASVLVVGLFVAFAAQANFCMDCAERTVQKYRANGDIYFEKDAMCCMAPCYGGYTVREWDKGYGCSTMVVSNELVEGDICNSSDVDSGCPNRTGGSRDPNYDDPGSDPDDGPGSPIILPLGDDTYRLTSISSGVQFDIRADGNRVQMGWTQLSTENAFVALDRNGNGRVDSGAELFGNYTPLASGASAANGFVALAELDADGDGVVDAADAAWQRLLLWTDRNHDGMSTAGELQPIGASVVTALETDHRRVGRKDQWGNEFRYMAHYRVAGGARASYYDVFFRTAQ
ncbi:MAG TPA: hypothetical protein VGF28_09075 [Thermoanaerobaculia bacterium]|jgi:hypothetical protein